MAACPEWLFALGVVLNKIEVEEGLRLRLGALVPDVRAAMAAGKAGIAGLSFYRGIPGSIGGALRMNAGAHGGETKDFLVEARGVDRYGNVHILTNADMGYSYRHCSAPDDLIFTQALLEGRAGDPDELAEEMREVTEYRQEKQPVKSRTGRVDIQKSRRS